MKNNVGSEIHERLDNLEALFYDEVKSIKKDNNLDNNWNETVYIRSPIHIKSSNDDKSLESVNVTDQSESSNSDESNG